jgi:hypothetical protein
MDLLISLKKYILNFKVVLLISILLLFSLFIVNPMFSLVGGSLNLSYTIITQDVVVILLTIISFITFVITYTLIQTTIIFRVEREYDFEKYNKEEIKERFTELLKFNVLFYLLIFFLCSFLYDVNLLQNPIINLLLAIVILFFWFIPQIIVMEKEKATTALIININYIKNNWHRLLYLFIVSLILVFITYVIDGAIYGNLGVFFSTVFFVLFVVPFIEILKTEVYLDKYSLLKPRTWRW